jgi:hypothetical protein
MRTYQAADGQPSLRPAGQGREAVYPEWVGRRFVPWSGGAVEDYARQVRVGEGELSEYEVARICRPNIYRVLRAQRFMTRAGELSEWIVTSNTTSGWGGYKPARLNLVLTPQNVVLDVYRG